MHKRFLLVIITIFLILALLDDVEAVKLAESDCDTSIVGNFANNSHIIYNSSSLSKNKNNSSNANIRLISNESSKFSKKNQSKNNKEDNNSYNIEYGEEKSVWNGMHAYWMWSDAVNNFDPWKLKNSGITDIFFLTKGTSGNLYYNELEHAINLCKKSGIRVHAWVICFNDKSKGSWIDPTDQNYQDYLRNIISNLINNYDIDGIHLDYVRYSGNAKNNHAAWQQTGGTSAAVNTITNFVHSIYDLIKLNNHELALSAALMPEKWDNPNLYGQDYTKLADYLDFLVPMIYKGTYKEDTNWIGTTTKWIVENSKGKPVITGILTYHSDEDQTMLPAWELSLDAKTALNNGALGFALFRYGLTLAVPIIWLEANIKNQEETKINKNSYKLSDPELDKTKNTISMQKTGLPILGLIISIFMILSAFYGEKKR